MTSRYITVRQHALIETARTNQRQRLIEVRVRTKSDKPCNSLIAKFNNLTVNKSSGSLTLSGDAQASTTLTMTAGIINAGSNKLTLGSGVASIGALTYTSGHINGFFERWIKDEA